jgi:hypothetical protein
MFTKKYYILSFIVASLIILYPKISLGAEQFSRDLYFGLQQDSDVIKLQEFLTDEGLYSGPITGNFFSLTLKGVKNFQLREGVTPVAGYFGPKTRIKANDILSSQIQASENQAISETGATTTPPVTPKNTTDVVNSLQSQMNLLLQQIVLLQQQLQTQQQIQAQQQNQADASAFSSNQNAATTSDAFALNISIDKEEIKNNGADLATIQVVIKLTSGIALENKSLRIKTSIYKDGIILEPFEESRLSDSQGIIIFKTRPTSHYDRCGWMKMSVHIIDDEDSKILYSKDIKIINVQPQIPSGGVCS